MALKRVRVKICGLTRVEDVQAAVGAGADGLGFVFYERSKRVLSIAQAGELLKHVPPLVSAVGLFVDAKPEFVREALARLPLTQLQFHGEETADYCRQFGLPYIKAVPMNSLSSVEAVAGYVAQYPDAGALLFDAFGGQTMGGSGQRFDWGLLPSTSVPIIIAGGLSAENVGGLLRDYRPFAVDVSSGVESMPGLKSSVKMNAFIDAVNEASV